MHVLVVVSSPAETSLVIALAQTAVDTALSQGATVTLLDLYRERFDPVLPDEEIRRRFSLEDDVQRSVRELVRADLVVFVHPEWWGQPPALLKGWIDRVFRHGIAFTFSGDEFTKKRLVPLLTEKSAAVFVTSDMDGATPIEMIWKDSILGYCGVSDIHFHRFCGVRRSSHSERSKWLVTVETTIQDIIARRDR